MKKIIFVVAFLIGIFAKGQFPTYEQLPGKVMYRTTIQDTAYKTIARNGKEYTLEYAYDTCQWMRPLVATYICSDDSCTFERMVAGKCKCEFVDTPKHYYAAVRVFYKKKQIGERMFGYYIKEGTCWDADPEAYLNSALSFKPKNSNQ